MAGNHAPPPTFAEAFRFWLKLGFISFGGPTGQIAIMHAELVEKRRWISEARFLHALNYCMLLPGPEATQLATYVGWLMHKTWGGIVAGSLFVLPSAFILWALSYIYVRFGTVGPIVAIFHGLKPAVVAIVAAAVIRIGQRALKNEIMWGVAGLAFVAIFFFKVPFPAIIFGAAVIGFAGSQLWPRQFAVALQSGHGSEAQRAVIHDEAEVPAHGRPSWKRAVQVVAVSMVLWWTPVLLLGGWLGWRHTLPQEGIFFSKAAVVTFGGAYAVLPYVSEQAVTQFHWVNPGQMLDGLGLAETTPGPLIMVLQFVGFMGGWSHPGSLSPLLAATLGAFITTWTTFVPCFLWIFLGAPYIEQMRGKTRLAGALSTVTAAVVGVVLNLAVWFGAHVFYHRNPDAIGTVSSNRIDWFAVAVCVVAFIGLVRWKWNLVLVVLGAGLLGLLCQGLFL